MKVAVMQPYLFPYLGYYQLVNCADMFVLYDDVAFIKQGRINRNRILSNGDASRITVPVPGASSNKRINELAFTEDVHKILKTIQQAYSKAPFFEQIYSLVERVLTYPERDITAVCQQGIIEVLDYLELKRTIIRSSELEYDRNLPAAKRLVAICDKLGSSDYVNSIGGQKLYDKQQFQAMGCQLSFLEMNAIEYSQGKSKSDFVPKLSIIDALMWCDKAQLKNLLGQYALI